MLKQPKNVEDIKKGLLATCVERCEIRLNLMEHALAITNCYVAY